MSQTQQNQDFQPLPEYSQTRNSNQTYTTVVTVRQDSDGSTSQHLQIISKK